MATVTRRPPCKCKDKSRCGHKPWVARVWADGRQQQASFKTKGEASGFILKVEQSKRDGAFADPRGDAETFGDAARRMIASKRTANTREVYATVLNVHLADFAGRRLRDVANDRAGVQEATVNHPRGKVMLSVLRETCQEAVNNGKLSGHRLNGLKANHVPGKRDLIEHTPQQIDTLARAMGDEEGELAVRLSRSLGLRAEEALALSSSDFITSIDKQVTAHVWHQFDKKTGESIPLKSKRDFKGRDIPVPPTLARMVREYVAKHGEGRLFSIKYRRYLERFHKAAKVAGLPDNFIPHQLRHGFATTLLAKNMPLTDVSRWLGDDPRTVASTYAHLLRGQEDRARDLLEADLAEELQIAA